MTESAVEKPRRSVVLCADDYGMNGGVCEGILALAEAGRISATSCMSVSPYWPDGAPALAGLRGRIGIGLHLTLTWGRPLGAMPILAPDGVFPPLGRVVLLAMARRLDGPEIEAEITRQLDAFEAATGRAPDFVDGHQHVHVLPGISAALLGVLSRRGYAGRIWLRDSADSIPAILSRRVGGPKALFVHGLARGFRTGAGAVGFDTNVGFSGFSAFDPARSVGADVARYLEALGAAPLVMCHPGLPVAGREGDEIAAAREREYAYFASDAFPELLAERGLALACHPGPREAGTRDRP